MKFTLNRNKILNSTSGLAIEFKKGVPTIVPPHMYSEAMAIGAMPEDETFDPDAKPVDPNIKGAPTDPEVRKVVVFKAFEALVLRNQRGDFTASGLPHPNALAHELGWRIDGRERDLLWAEFQQGAK